MSQTLEDAKMACIERMNERDSHDEMDRLSEELFTFLQLEEIVGKIAAKIPGVVGAFDLKKSTIDDAIEATRRWDSARHTRKFESARAYIVLARAMLLKIKLFSEQ